MRLTTSLLLLGATLSVAAPVAQDPSPAPAPPSGPVETSPPPQNDPANGDGNKIQGPPQPGTEKKLGDPSSIPTYDEIQQAIAQKIAQENQKSQGGSDGKSSQSPSGGSGPLGIFDEFLKPFESIFGGLAKRQGPLSIFENLLGGGSPPPSNAPAVPGQNAGTGHNKRQLGGFNPLDMFEGLLGGGGNGGNQAQKAPGQDAGKDAGKNAGGAPAPAPSS